MTEFKKQDKTDKELTVEIIAAAFKSGGLILNNKKEEELNNFAEVIKKVYKTLKELE